MKSFLLTVATLMAFTGGMFAQNLPPEFRWEVGANGGYSVITRPVGPPAVYTGTRTNIVKDYSLRASYYFNSRWMMTLDLGDRRWETFGPWKLNDKYGVKLNSIDVPFLLADHALTQTVQMNHVIPFYTQFRNFNRANFYFGVTAGLVETLNDASRSYSKYNSPTDSGYTYVSGYHYGSGMGYTLGLQTGFIYYIVPRIGVTAELALRYVNVKTIDINYAAPNAHYHVMHFPQTVGIRYRIF
jgi:hypothetical protein